LRIRDQLLGEAIWLGFPIAEVSCATKYLSENSSINFRRIVRYGFGCFETAVDFPSLQMGFEEFTALSRRTNQCGRAVF
jgi:hypothetical protein